MIITTLRDHYYTSSILTPLNKYKRINVGKEKERAHLKVPLGKGKVPGGEINRRRVKTNRSRHCGHQGWQVQETAAFLSTDVTLVAVLSERLPICREL